MAFIALYRKWRPLVFEDVVEQEHIVKTLKTAVKTGRIAHAYLFCGTRGTGKTSMAHIMSRAVNCKNPNNGNPCNQCEICRGILSGNILDVIEIDAASNNSVENVRDIREEVRYSPVNTQKKVYIIDEVHMLSQGAFNALLKTLEEPPGHAVFILATTEPHKLPATILSRCQRYDFKRITIDGIKGRLNKICTFNSVAADDDALHLIAVLSDGALRDAISLLDQCISSGSNHLTRESVILTAGLIEDECLHNIAKAIINKNITDIFSIIESVLAGGKSISRFFTDIIGYMRNLLVCRLVKNPGNIIHASNDAIDRMIELSKKINVNDIVYAIKELSKNEYSIRYSTQPSILLETVLINIIEDNISNPESASLKERIERLEKKLSSANTKNKITGEENTGPDITTYPKADENLSIKTNVQQQNEIESDKNEKNRTILQSNKEISRQQKTEDKQQHQKISGWNKVLEFFKNNGRYKFYTYLLNTYAISIDNKTIGIVFENENKYIKEIMSKAENKKIIKNTLMNIYGKEYNIKMLSQDVLSNNYGFSENNSSSAIKTLEKFAEVKNVPFEVIEDE